MAKVMPGPVREQFESIDHDAKEQLSEAKAKVATQQRRFFLYVGLLVLWFFGQPFADPPTLHFVAQSLGLMLLALATGSLRVLSNCSECIARLQGVTDSQLRLRDQYGVDLENNLNNPIETAKQLANSKQLEKLQTEITDTKERLREISSLLRMSEVNAYLELFGVLRSKTALAAGQGNAGKKPDGP